MTHGIETTHECTPRILQTDTDVVNSPGNPWSAFGRCRFLSSHQGSVGTGL